MIIRRVAVIMRARAKNIGGIKFFCDDGKREQEGGN